MDRRIGYIIVALLAALLFFVAIGYKGWFCGESILGPNCGKFEVSKTTGGLLLTAGLLIFLAAVFIIIHLAMGASWAGIVAAVLTVISAILSIAGVFYYLDKYNIWSPFIASMGMSFTIALSAIIIMDLVGKA